MDQTTVRQLTYPVLTPSFKDRYDSNEKQSKEPVLITTASKVNANEGNINRKMQGDLNKNAARGANHNRKQSTILEVTENDETHFGQISPLTDQPGLQSQLSTGRCKSFEAI